MTFGDDLGRCSRSAEELLHLQSDAVVVRDRLRRGLRRRNPAAFQDARLRHQNADPAGQLDLLFAEIRPPLGFRLLLFLVSVSLAVAGQQQCGCQRAGRDSQDAQLEGIVQQRQ